MVILKFGVFRIKLKERNNKQLKQWAVKYCPLIVSSTLVSYKKLVRKFIKRKSSMSLI